MLHPRAQNSRAVPEAYGVLGLEELSLRTHPDKNPDDPNATQQFQKISEAYRILLKHLNPEDNSNSDDDEDDYMDAEFMYEIYRQLFELFMRDEEHAYCARAYRFKPRKEEESPEQYRARIELSLKEQQAGEERRQRERLALKAKKEQERQQERCEAEERKKIKTSTKKATAKTQREKDLETIRMRQENSQRIRSAVFAAARNGDARRVEQGVWEEHVDAAGGEVKEGCQGFVDIAPIDPRETLLHIAAEHGDLDLVRWLDGHGAELEESNSDGLTAFHVALKRGRLTVVGYFFDEHTPGDDTASIYRPPPSTSLLALAVESLEPELVWMILDKKLAAKEDMNSAWECFSAARESLVKREPTKAEGIHDIEQLLAGYGGFTLRTPGFQKEKRHLSYSSPKVAAPSADLLKGSRTPGQGPSYFRGQVRGRGRGHGRGSSFSSAAMR